ncbi:hypothetical protein D9758_004499 [Tetrapyrgos nigripes]|uniref:DUF6534 domain-containing protein n=1 Tax=Tetrapyrgos nigripes TaxID=182062 RepID=A0A8H5LSI0_9AGAR|nr:hypothetical protein D9758_004499 [Tetrapyrgos nigripes]
MPAAGGIPDIYVYFRHRRRVHDLPSLVAKLSSSSTDNLLAVIRSVTFHQRTRYERIPLLDKNILMNKYTVSAAEFLKLEKFAKFGSSKIPSVLRLSSAAVCDTGIAISLCYFLQQKRTGYKRTDEIIDHLMLFSINSGLLTSLTSIACLITYLIVPKTWVYIALCFLISRLYANTFLNALNSRHILQSDDNDMDTPVLPKFHSTEVAAGGRGRLYRGLSVKTPTQIDVLVVTETVTQSDLSRVSSSQSNSKSEPFCTTEIKRKDTGSDSSSYSIQEVPRARLSYGSKPARATITQ